MAYETIGLPLPQENIMSDPSYFGFISREEAESILKQRATCEGTYLVRRGADGYRLSVLEWKNTECVVSHFKLLLTAARTYYIEPQYTFPTITGLLGYYKAKHTNMEQPLTVPCAKIKSPTKKMNQTPVKPNNLGTVHEINRDAITLKSQLSSGKFTDIWKGTMTSYEDGVIVKTENNDEMSSKYLLQEAYVLNSVRHTNIVRIFGIISGKPLYVVLEFCQNRDLLDYLLRNDTYLVAKTERIRFGIETASALHHISGMQYVHRNIRSANILLTRNLTCKLAGFSHAVRLDQNGNYYSTEDDKPFEPNAIRWMSLEAAEQKWFSKASDVWAFGCLLNEIFTDGEAPFSCVLMRNIVEKVKAGFRSPKPESLPASLYELMLRCWHPDMEKRPSFQNIQESLQEHLSASSNSGDLFNFDFQDDVVVSSDNALEKSSTISPKSPNNKAKKKKINFNKIKTRVMVNI